MSDRPTFVESYARATQSTNLRHSERVITDTDRLAAMAWADRQLASDTYRAKAANDAQAIRKLHALWAEQCDLIAVKRRWTATATAEFKGKKMSMTVPLPQTMVHKVAKQSLDHWLFDVCPHCCGRKYKLLGELMAEDGLAPPPEGRDVLSDAPCTHCNGTGRSPLDVEPQELKPLVERALLILQERYDDFEQKARRKLGAMVRD